MANINVIKGTILTIQKKVLFFTFIQYHQELGLMVKKSLKNTLNCCKLQMLLKNQTRQGNNFHFKDRILKYLTSGVVCKFQCGLCDQSYYGECIRHLNIRTGEHTGILPFTRNKLSKSKNSSVANHLLFCSHLASYGDCSILMCESKKVLLELKEGLLIVRAHPSLNRSSITPLCMFSRSW